MKAWGKSLLSLFTISGSMVALAVVSTVPYLAAAIVFPLLAVGFLYIEHENTSIRMKLDFPESGKVGEKLEVNAEVTVEGQAGLYLFSFPVPSHFTREEKSNVHLAFLSSGSRTLHFSYDVVPLRRGNAAIPNLMAFVFPVYGIHSTTEVMVPAGSHITVQPALTVLSRSNMQTKASRYIPKSANSRVGPMSSDFNSIRGYMAGDSLRTINWKASARSTNGSLYVNDYYREGLRNYIFIADRGNTMKYGTREENPFEYSISFILSYTRILIRNGFNVGLWKVPAWLKKERSYVTPASGSDQYSRIRDFLIRSEIRATPVQNYQMSPGLVRVIGETRPAIFLTTNLETENLAGISGVVRSAIALGGTVCLVDILPYSIITKYKTSLVNSDSVTPLFMGARKKRYASISPGCRIISWDPVEQGVGGTISRAMGLTAK